MASQLKVSVGQYSDKGSKPTNQDYCGVEIPDENLRESKGIAIAIADGISSSEHSKEASSACVTGFLADYFSTPETWSVKKSVQQVLTALNSWLYNQGSQERNRHKGHVTTLSALILKSTTCHVIHIGDSRIYQLREGYLKQLTVDHKTWVSKDKNYLSRAMGADTHLKIDYSKHTVEVGDLYLLSTDGTHEYVSEDNLLKIIRENKNYLDKAAEIIVQQAQINGSPDNVTCQLLLVNELPVQDPNDVYQVLTELPFPPDLAEGMIIDGYRVIREVSSSTRSQLYLVEDTETGMNLILKTPSVNYEDDPAYIDRFIREEWIGRRIANENVVKVYEPTRRRRFLYLISEFLEGSTLRQWMRDNPKPELEEVRLLVEQIAKGLQAFHRLEMLHQDLKPENIILHHAGTVKLIDFGSTKVAGIAEINTPLDQTNLLGTKNYTAPEYANDQPGTNRSDIYSLGVITYQMLTGELPYGEMSAKWKTTDFRGTLIYTPVTDYNAAIPKWISASLRKAVHPDPTKRYDELSEFMYDLRYPNLKLSIEDTRPLIDRNPVGFWQGLCAIFFGIIIYLLFLIKN
ncbi:MAG TPA: bifunctional protein-serine/threonine kinase/phosphatase [Thiotrichaceae bacterium]|jgi:serine/threonine protein kinase/serine/threonine protein phosphatase PrpC|nr:bifunctional protein-serine/threonine kinase/phosphatase [Thiotrichaceae bacterium]HIM07082.1 bifunctional protein-serine/threonine kinase/phosphatase [Gammaproteobacteria bacterium]